jgi:GNAT superfamily N-acetyltransferase
MSDMLIRKAVGDDAFELSKLYKKVWDEQKGCFPDGLLQARQPDEHGMKAWLSKETYFVAITNKTIVGVVGCFMEHGTCKAIHMVVDKTWRGKGIGSTLLNTVEEFAREHQAHKLWFDTSTRLVDAIHFYKHKGFRVAGELQRHFWGEDIVLFEKLLS